MPIGREREGTRYLTVTGLLHRDNRLELQPGFATDQPDYATEDRKSELMVEFLNDAGAAILRHGVAADPVCADGAHVDYWLVADKVPFPGGARGMRVLREDIVIEEIRIPEQGPVVRLEWESGRERVGEQLIGWSGEHPEKVELNYIVSYSSDDGRSWRPLSRPTTETELLVNFDELPGGERCMVGIMASDGFNTVTITSEPFDVPTKPCLAMILAPEDGTVIPPGEIVTLQGQGFYLEENRAELEVLDWQSSQDGPLGRGQVLRLEGLSEGAHTITLRAGIEGRVGESSIQITVAGG